MTSYSLPRGVPDSEGDSRLATAQWLAPEKVVAAFGQDPRHPPVSPILIGRSVDVEPQRFIEIDDDRHIVTIAGSRSGKGVSLIIPNLLNYPGSVICIDPKGENATITARWRHEALGQDIVVLDPFGVAKGVEEFRRSYNPLAWIDPEHPEAIDDVGGLADALVVKSGARDPHWDESARAFLRGAMLLMLTFLEPHDRTLPFLRSLVSTGLPDDEGGASFAELLRVMRDTDAFEGAVASAGATMAAMGDNERGGVRSTIARNTEFLEGGLMRTALESSTFNPSTLKGTPTTVYLVLPEWRFATHARYLRLIINSLLTELQRGTAPNAASPAVLFIFDEFASLGYLESIERAASYIAGFGVKLWTILQDLSQLQNLYPGRWETFLANAGLLTAFGNSDVTTLEYLSKRLGDTEVVQHVRSANYQYGSQSSRAGLGRILDGLTTRGLGAGAFAPDSQSESEGESISIAPQHHRTALLTPDEVSRHFARETGSALIHVSGLAPFPVRRITYYDDPLFKNRAARNPYRPA